MIRDFKEIAAGSEKNCSAPQEPHRNVRKV